MSTCANFFIADLNPIWPDTFAHSTIYVDYFEDLSVHYRKMHSHYKLQDQTPAFQINNCVHPSLQSTGQKHSNHTGPCIILELVRC